MYNFYVGLLWYLVFLMSVTLHEACHAYFAKLGGDLTAYEGGQLSVDPFVHMRREPFGMIVLPLLSLAFYGWPMGFAHVPYDLNWAWRYPRRAAVMSLAGPILNLLLALACALGVRFGLSQGVFVLPEAVRTSLITVGNGHTAWNTVAMILSVFFSMNLIMAFFNLLPVPPLDGSGALPLLLSQKAGQKYQAFINQPLASLIGLFIAWNLFPKIYPFLYLRCLEFIYS